MDTIQSVTAELAALKSRALPLAAKGRDMSDAEVSELEGINTQALLLTSKLTGLKNANLVADMSRGEVFEDHRTGEVTRDNAAKGYLTAESIKSSIRAKADGGLKSLVAAGSTAIPTSLEKNPIKLGQPNSLGLLSLLQTKVRDTSKYSFLQQTVATTNAAAVAPGATKPVSVYTAKSVDNELVTIAHLSEPVGKMLLRDNDDLQRFLEGELYSGVLRKVAAGAISTIASTSGSQTYATAAGYSDVKGADGIYAAASKLRSLDYSPSLVIIGFDKYDGMRTAKAAGSGEYLGGNYLEGGDLPVLWGIPTFVSPDVAAGTALVLDSSYVGLSTDGYGIEVEMNPYTGFNKNEIEFRAEGRFATDVFRPEAVVKVTFTA